MTDNTATTIDQLAIAAFLAEFDQETVMLLASAAETDLHDWTERLLDAWQAEDLPEQQRARHSLQGICSNFGMASLLAMAADDLSGDAARDRFRCHRQAVIAVLRDKAEAR